jgi:glycosyltransferase involved in cell wall biosynthesis
MTNLPKVSIVTPSYNQAEFLEKTILSVVNQDYPDIEYIIIDGGSTDGSQEIIKKYSDKIASWVSEKDNGQSDAINKGFKKCTGDIVAWINSDDLYTAGAVASVVKYFTEHPDVDMVHGNIDFIDGGGKFLSNVKTRDFTLPQLIITNRISQPSVFFKRKIFDEIGYLDEWYHYIMDYDFWIRVAIKFNIRHIGTTVAQFRLHGQSKTVFNSDLFIIENLILLDRLLSHYELQEDVKKSAFTSMQSLLPKFLFNQPAEMQKYMEKHGHEKNGKILELAEYLSTLPGHDIGFSDLKTIKARLHEYFLSYVREYPDYQNYVTDKSIDTAVNDELYSISYYLYEKGYRHKSRKLLVMAICSNIFGLKYDNIKMVLKKYIQR